MKALRAAMKAGFIASCHDVSEGGLAVAVCEMLLGGDMGATLDVAGITLNKPLQGLRGRGAEPHMRSEYALFSESNTRWVVEVWREDASGFEELMQTRGICICNIGETIRDRRVLIRDSDKKLVNLSLEEVRTAWTGKIG
jgi:phosphoribosylformylglycinamidine synthase